MPRLDLKIPPLAVGAVLAIGMWLVSDTLPEFAYPQLRILAMGMGIVGAGITGFAMLSFWRAQTTPNPMKPSSASFLVTSGIYRFTNHRLAGVVTLKDLLKLLALKLNLEGVA
ncbi:MAG: hypothetical protein HP494_07145 [Nitrospira sp.]|nr:hypothetical protein [Nitrospira sp.]